MDEIKRVIGEFGTYTEEIWMETEERYQIIPITDKVIEAAKILKTEFKKRGLKMTLKTKIMTPEQWYDSYIKMKGLRDK